MARKPLAFAKWQYPYTLTAEQKEKKAQLDRKEESEYSLPEGANRELYNVFFSALREKKAKWMNESKDYCKYICCERVRGLAFFHLIFLWECKVLMSLNMPCKSVLPLPVGNIHCHSITGSFIAACIRAQTDLVLNIGYQYFTFSVFPLPISAKALVPCSSAKALRMQIEITHGHTLKLHLLATTFIFAMAGSKLMRS